MSLVSPDLTIPANVEALQSLAIEFKAMIDYQEREALLTSFENYLEVIGLNLHHFPRCINASTADDFIESYSARYVENAIAATIMEGIIAESFGKLLLKGWSQKSIDGFRVRLVGRLCVAVSPLLQGTFIQNWFDFLDENMTASRLLQYAICSNLLTSERPDYEGVITLVPHTVTYIFWWKFCRLGPTKRYSLDQGRYKVEGDNAAKLKNYREALNYYDAVTFMGIESPHLLNNLSNSAAIRLRFIQDQPDQRGLGLALSKKWNEAIVDFERAVELDPLSPAKKELEVARRQVMRRIGN